MTSVGQVVEKGEGKILSNFREIPALSRNLVEDITGQLVKADINGILSIGNAGNPVGQTNVDLNKVGMILLGGLNPVAKANEEGFDVDNKAMSTVMEYEDLHSIEEL
jgi:repressor of nif and glnA expression